MTKEKRQIERTLIEEFMEKYYNEIGEYPTVITKYNRVENKDDLKILSMNTLEGYFTPYLPKHFGKTISLKSQCRIRRIVELRFMFFFIARSMKYNLKEIGTYCNGKDHTTVIHGLTTFRHRYELEEGFRALYHNIINDIKKDYNESPALEHFNKMED